jgi:hypothetical protein
MLLSEVGHNVTRMPQLIIEYCTRMTPEELWVASWLQDRLPTPDQPYPMMILGF